jgi:hypothetical protein
MNFRRTEDRRFALEKVRLPLVALIDVVLFLLLYFVMAGTLAPEEMELPSALKTDKQAAGPGADLQPQILYADPLPPGRAFGERSTSAGSAPAPTPAPERRDGPGLAGCTCRGGGDGAGGLPQHGAEGELCGAEVRCARIRRWWRRC